MKNRLLFLLMLITGTKSYAATPETPIPTHTLFISLENAPGRPLLAKSFAASMIYKDFDIGKFSDEDFSFLEQCCSYLKNHGARSLEPNQRITIMIFDNVISASGQELLSPQVTLKYRLTEDTCAFKPSILEPYRPIQDETTERTEKMEQMLPR